MAEGSRQVSQVLFCPTKQDEQPSTKQGSHFPLEFNFSKKLLHRHFFPSSDGEAFSSSQTEQKL